MLRSSVAQQITFVTVEQILFIHDQLVKRFGGSFGIRDMGLIESAAARPQATYGGEYLYGSLFDKTAALLQSLLKNHAFVDGNKRTALTSASLFLSLNSYKLISTHGKEVQFAINVDNARLSIEEISSWLEKNTLKAKT